MFGKHAIPRAEQFLIGRHIFSVQIEGLKIRRAFLVRAQRLPAGGVIRDVQVYRKSEFIALFPDRIQARIIGSA